MLRSLKSVLLASTLTTVLPLTSGAAAAAPAAAAPTAPATMSQLNAARQAVDAHFKEAEGTLTAATAAAKKATADFRTCHNGRLQLQFDDTLGRTEAARKTLESARRETNALRHELEGTRLKIESDHRQLLRSYSGKTPDSFHETSSQAYIEGMQTSYLKRFDAEVIPFVEGYGKGIQGYSAVLEKYSQFCAQSGYTGAAGAAFVKDIGADVEALSAEATQLHKSVSDARKGTLGPAVSSK